MLHSIYSRVFRKHVHVDAPLYSRVFRKHIHVYAQLHTQIMSLQKFSIDLLSVPFV